MLLFGISGLGDPKKIIIEIHVIICKSIFSRRNQKNQNVILINILIVLKSSTKTLESFVVFNYFDEFPLTP